MDEKELYSQLSKRMTMNRRRFMMGMMAAVGATAGSAALAACGAAPTATPAPVPPTATTVSLPATPTKAAGGTAPTPTAAATKAASQADLTPTADEMQAKWKGTGQVVVSDWGGAVKDALKTSMYDPFEEFSGIKIVNDTIQDSSQYRVMVDANAVQWDVIHDAWSVIIKDNRAGKYFDPIDYSLVDVDNIPETFRHPDALGFLPYSWALSYRTDVFGSDVPKTWADFWDQQKFPGKRSLNGDVHPPIEFALIADGVPIDKVWDTLKNDPGATDRAYKKLDQIKGDVAQWWSTGALPAQLLNDKEVVMASAWNGRISTIKNLGAKVDLTFNQAMLAMDCWAVIHGGPNTANAMKFVGYASSPKPQARFSNVITYGFTNSKAADYISQDRLAILPTSPENLKVQFVYDEQWWADNDDKQLERFVAWKSA